MCFAGGYGAKIDLQKVVCADDANSPDVLLFSESNTRFLCEVTPENASAFEAALGKIPHAKIGDVTVDTNMEITSDTVVIRENLDTLKEAWQKPLRW
jgi:phosphoribosylformylglycinamidine synthase